ncbi:MAG: sigma-E processing peptidase SpoIIGA [Clostridia bacterium]|nr:sigma-E processing peptidase SpoIIGA [Clostridia bacterium]
MQTLYIDVYFLVNFTVNYLAVYFAVIFSKVPTSPKRLIISSLIGALVAVITVLSPEVFLLKIILSFLGLVFTGAFALKPVSLHRRLRFVFSFIIFEALVGGAVTYAWNLFDTYLYESISLEGSVPVNRKLLFFSVIVLLSIGVFKMIVSFFSNIESQGACEIEISWLSKTVKTEAFIDSGNLAIDPMDMRPILLIKESIAEQLNMGDIINLKDPDLLPREIRRRIRLIPISRGGTTHVLTGVRADSVKVIKENVCSEIAVTLAIDKEGGNYGGFYALIPSGALGDEYN